MKSSPAAIERARELYSAHIKSGCLVAPNFIENIADALNAAASEARAAAIEECAREAKGMSIHPPYTATAMRPAIVAAIRALATPAPSEGK